VAEEQGQFGNQEQGEHPSWEAVTRRLVKTVTEDTRVPSFSAQQLFLKFVNR
jgi:hypothetical protein